MPRERGIPFSQTLVNPVRLGIKTETRRLIRPDKVDRPCPYGVEGDKLWVRESYACFRDSGTPCRIEDAEYVVFRDGWMRRGGLRAGQEDNEPETRRRRLQEAIVSSGSDAWLWRPPMHLPRWASRIDLDVISTEQERVQDITEAAAVAEGFTPELCEEVMRWRSVEELDAWRHAKQAGAEARFCFKLLWGDINGARAGASWDQNPVVWVVKFKLAAEV